MKGWELYLGDTAWSRHARGAVFCDRDGVFWLHPWLGRRPREALTADPRGTLCRRRGRRLSPADEKEMRL